MATCRQEVWLTAEGIVNPFGEDALAQGVGMRFDGTETELRGSISSMPAGQVDRAETGFPGYCNERLRWFLSQ